MNLRLIGLSTGVVMLASTLGACDAQQQDPQCVVARAVSDGSTGSFATSYTLVPRPGQDTTTACTQLKPEPVGLQKYFNQDPNAKDTVAIRVDRVGDVVKAAAASNATIVLDPDAPNSPNSVGVLTTDAPGADNYCQVPELSETRLEARSTNGGADVSLAYAWSNLRIYNTSDIPGTLFVADLTYTENGCQADYKVKGIWPVVSCSKVITLDTDSNGDGKKDTATVPDETKCLPNADPSVGRLRGSGINPSFDVMCDPNALICVLKDPTADFP
jgi:hypothetical protein